MFGFLKKGKEESPIPETIDIKLSELLDWFEGAMEEELREKRKHAEQMHNDILEKFREVRGSLDRLDRSRITGTERLHTAANMIKESFVKKKYPPLREVFSFREGLRPDYSYFMSFQEKGMEAIRGLRDSTPKQSILLSRYFKREGGDLVESIKHAEQALLDFREYLKAGSGSLSTLNRIRSTVKACGKLMEEADNLELKARSLEDQIRQVGERKSELEKTFLDLLKSKEWNEMNALGKEESKAREALREAEMRMNSELSSIRRPLKRIEHVLASRGKLTPIQKNTLRDFIRNPFKTVMTGKGEKNLATCMNAVRRQLERIETREKFDTEGIAEKFDEGVSKLKATYLEQKQVLENTQSRLRELSNMTSTKQGIENEIKRISEDIGGIEEELRAARSGKSGKNDQVSEKIRELQAVLLEESQRRVNIRL